MTADEIARELRQYAAKLIALAGILEGKDFTSARRDAVREAAQDDPRGEADR
jgi:hypothetical protein